MKFSIVTPTHNSEKYLEETILSVITQKGLFEIEYIIVDSLSTDKTLEIANKYKDIVTKYNFLCNNVNIEIISEEDMGMYDAINKGFRNATGDIYAWINSDDIYMPGAFETVSNVFSNNKNIQWLSGITSYIHNNSTISYGKFYKYNQVLLRKGAYGQYLEFVHQDSIFWREPIWKKANGIDIKYKLAGDYFLWNKFCNIDNLYVINSNFSCFRIRENQLSSNIEEYRKEMHDICKISQTDVLKLKFYRVLEKFINSNKILKIINIILFGKYEIYVL